MTRLTQGCFSLLPDLTDDQIKKQIDYLAKSGFAISIEWTDDPHPRNPYWEMWGLPLFDLPDSAAIFYELAAARKAHPGEVRGLLLIKGAIPGSKGGFVTVRPAIKAKGAN